jgi:hypothetical protein
MGAVTAFPRLRLAALAWLCVWAPSYALVWGPRNFLQLCDVAVFITVIGLWRGSALLLSSQAVSSIVVDAIWTVDAGARLVAGRHLLGGTEYMWDATRPLFVRLLSLFHLFLPVLLYACVRRVGYDRRGLPLQAGLAAAVLVLSRLLGNAGKNLNFVVTDPFFHRSLGPPVVHLLITWAALTVAVYLPTHLVLSRLPRPLQKA